MYCSQIMNEMIHAYSSVSFNLRVWVALLLNTISFTLLRKKIRPLFTIKEGFILHLNCSIVYQLLAADCVSLRFQNSPMLLSTILLMLCKASHLYKYQVLIWSLTTSLPSFVSVWLSFLPSIGFCQSLSAIKTFRSDYKFLLYFFKREGMDPAIISLGLTMLMIFKYSWLKRRNLNWIRLRMVWSFLSQPMWGCLDLSQCFLSLAVITTETFWTHLYRRNCDDHVREQ